MVLVILCGYLLNLRIDNLGLNITLLIISCLTTVSCVFLAISAQNQLREQIRLADDYQHFQWAEVTFEPSMLKSYDSTLEGDTESNMTSPNDSSKGPSLMLVGEVSTKNPRYAQHQSVAKHSIVNPDTQKLIVRLKKQDVENQYQQLQLVLKKRNLGIICIYALPLFPAIYFLTVLKIISDDMSMVLMIVAGCIAKSLINYLLVAGHIGLYEDENSTISRTAQNLQKKLSEQRRVMKMNTESRQHQKNLHDLTIVAHSAV